MITVKVGRKEAHVGVIQVLVFVFVFALLSLAGEPFLDGFLLRVTGAEPAPAQPA